MGPKMNSYTALSTACEQILDAMMVLNLADGEMKSLRITLSIPINTGNVDRVQDIMSGIAKGISKSKTETVSSTTNIDWLPNRGRCQSRLSLKNVSTFSSKGH